MLLKDIYKEYDQARLRERIRLEVEARQAQERLEKELRKQAAEERRAAVVERIRKQAELEEARRREAELALQRIAEAAARAEQWEADRLLTDQATILMEDQLSMLYEQDCREKAERIRWKAAERDKLIAWEAAQQAKDLLDEEQRKARLSELEIKRKKLEELRALQAVKVDDSKLKEEGERINKQMRIQNRAKFVSKKIHHPAANESSKPEPVDVPVLLRMPSMSMKAQEAVQAVVVDLAPEVMAFVEKVHNTSSEGDLRTWQQDIMSEKRAMRLEQRQRHSHNLEETGTEESGERRIHELTVQGDAISKRLEELVSKDKNDESKAVEVEAAPAVPAAAAGIAEALAVVEDADTVVFKKVEVVLREAHRILRVLHDCSYNCQQLDEHPARAMTILIMDMSRLSKEINPSNDPLGYADKLTHSSEHLATALKKIERASTKASAKAMRPGSGKAIEIKRPVSAGTKSATTAATEPVDLLSSTSSPIIPTVGTMSRADSMQIVEVEEDGDEEAKDSDAVEMEDPSSLPGWEECLYTSMFSAAHHAAYFGYIDVLQFLCKYFDCFTIDKKGRTPLFFAALANKLECVVELVALDPQWIEVGDSKGDTALHAAAIANGVEVLAFLLSCEVHPDTANFQGLTPSHLARSHDALQILQAAGAQLYCVDNTSRMPLWFACFEGRSDCVDFLCQQTPQKFLLWPDHEGETCLHKASAQGHHTVVEILCKYLPTIEDLYVLNKKQHTACHVAANARVLQVLYEQGANLWVKDSKERVPLFFASFFGRTDCVEMLLNLALSTNSRGSPSRSGSRPGSRPGSQHGKPSSPRPSDIPLLTVPENIRSRDTQGDLALHAACLCGFLPVVSLLSYFLRDEENKGRLKPSDLAKKAGHQHIARFVESIEGRRKQGHSNQEIFGVDFPTYASFITYYGARWHKGYDSEFNAIYFIDRITNVSQWDKPDLFDMTAAEEKKFDTACNLLQYFYTKYNPDKLKDINDILSAYRGRYTELFISLANKYQVEDLSMFSGIHFD